MPTDQESKVFSLLQPDLLTVEDLVRTIQSRCCRIKNLDLMSKEELVELFRRVILPLPQRFYRTNRRGKMLSSCRAKAGLEASRKDEGCSYENSNKVSTSNSCLKSPADNSDLKKRVSSSNIEGNHCESKSLDNIVIKDRKKINGDDRSEEEERKNSKILRSGSPSEQTITLKRSLKNEKPNQSQPPTERKKQRTAIKWP